MRFDRKYQSTEAFLACYFRNLDHSRSVVRRAWYPILTSSFNDDMPDRSL